MTSVELSPTQLPHLNELNKLLGLIRKETEVSIDHTNGDEVAWHLMRRIELQNLTPKIMELAVTIFDHCKGMAATEVMSDDRLLNLKADVQRKWFDGKLAKWSGLYARAERACKDFE